MKMKALAGMLVFGLGATAMAQPQGPGPGQGGYGPCWGGHGPYWQDEGKEAATRWHERAQQRMDDLHGKLKLDASQEKGWSDFRASIKANMKKPGEYAKTDFASMTAPQRMERMQELMKEREARMAKHLEAVKTFYATLTPEQQRIFDAETLPGRGGRWKQGGQGRQQAPR